MREAFAEGVFGCSREMLIAQEVAIKHVFEMAEDPETYSFETEQAGLSGLSDLYGMSGEGPDYGAQVDVSKAARYERIASAARAVIG
jgi:hypothetical protein